MPDQLLTSAAVARILCIARQSLYRLTSEGRGPRPIRLGDGPRPRIRYAACDVQEYLDSHRAAPAGRQEGNAHGA